MWAQAKIPSFLLLLSSHPGKINCVIDVGSLWICSNHSLIKCLTSLHPAPPWDYLVNLINENIVSSDFRCVLSAASKSVCRRVATVWLSTRFSRPEQRWWAQFVISAKLSFVTAESAWALTLAVVPWKMLFALNANAMSTATVSWISNY